MHYTNLCISLFLLLPIVANDVGQGGRVHGHGLGLCLVLLGHCDDFGGRRGLCRRGRRFFRGMVRQVRVYKFKACLVPEENLVRMSVLVPKRGAN